MSLLAGQFDSKLYGYSYQQGLWDTIALCSLTTKIEDGDTENKVDYYDYSNLMITEL